MGGSAKKFLWDPVVLHATCSPGRRDWVKDLLDSPWSYVKLNGRTSKTLHWVQCLRMFLSFMLWLNVFEC
jgi:hypothetical protein